MKLLSVKALRDRFYDGERRTSSGASYYSGLLANRIEERNRVLDIGVGPGDGRDHPLKGRVKKLVGLDPDRRVLSNPGIDEGVVGRIERIPLADASFDVVVSKFTLEHIADPESAAQEVFRMLQPGGVFIFRTPNLWHYATLLSRWTPLWVHKRVLQWVDSTPGSGASPYPTLYRCNTRRRIRRVFTRAGFFIEELRTIEEEPSYLQFSAPTFLFGVVYERVANLTDLFSPFRVTIIGVLRKPGQDQGRNAGVGSFDS